MAIAEPDLTQLGRKLATKLSLLRTGVEGSKLPFDRVAVRRDSGGIEIYLGFRFQREMPVLVMATNQHCGVVRFELADMGWDVADRQTNPSIIGLVRLRAMHKLHMMK